jgi:hypothetical protein
MKLRGGEFSTGTTGNFQPELTNLPRYILTSSKREGTACSQSSITYHW